MIRPARFWLGSDRAHGPTVRALTDGVGTPTPIEPNPVLRNPELLSSVELAGSNSADDLLQHKDGNGTQAAHLGPMQSFAPARAQNFPGTPHLT